MSITVFRVLQKTAWISVVCALCPFWWVGSTLAQVETTTGIRGIVSDSSGAIVPGAQVTVKNVNTGQTRTDITNAQGSYSFLSLSPGTYNVTVAKQGFKTGAVVNRVVQVGEPAEVDVSLQVGATADTVTVSAAGEELITTTTAEVSSRVPSSLVANVPLNGRNVFDLAALVPGSVPQTLTTTQLDFSQTSLNKVQAAGLIVSSGVTLSGMRDNSVNVSIDGSNVQSPVYQQSTALQSPDDIQELKIESGNMNAEFGNGVSAVNIITKSGTNQFHADLYDYYRNDVLDANTYFANLKSKGRATYQWNQFGAAGGGPIKANKLLFFSNYEGFRLKQESFATELVPDLNLREGNFSGTGTTVYNPYSYNPKTGLRSPFPGDEIPFGPTHLCAPQPTCVDPAIAAFIQKWVFPPNGTLNNQPVIEGNDSTTLRSDQATLRLDWLQNSKSLIYGRYTYFNSTSSANGLQPLEGTQNPYSSQNGVIHWTQNISASLLNDALVGYSRSIWGDLPISDAPDVSTQVGIVNTMPLPGGPSIGGTTYNLDSTNSSYLIGTGNKIQAKDDLSFAWGVHNFKVGGEVISDRLSYPSVSDFKGYFDFTDTWSAACPGGNAACAGALGSSSAGGVAYADFLLGTFNNDLFQSISDTYNGQQIYYGIYGQDSWRLTRNLTLNYGLRYEYWSPWVVPNNTTVGFNFSTQQIQYALQNPLDYLNPAKCYGKCAPLNPRLPRENYTVGSMNFAPRVGLAYNMHSQTVLRAAFGIFYNGNWNNNQFSNIQTGAAPFFLRDELQNDVSAQLPPAFVSQQFPAPGPTGVPLPNSNPPATFRFAWPHYPIPAVDEWSVSLQQGLGSYWSFEADYIGLHDVHEFQFIDVNAPALPQGSLLNVPLQNRRPYTQWGTLGTWAPIGWNRYNGLTVSLKNRSWHNLSLIANFTWQKAIISSDIGASDQGETNYRSPYIFSGPSPITPYNSFVAGYSYQLPLGKGKVFGNSLNPVLDGFLGGWVVSGITRFSDGSPQPIQTADQSNTGETIAMANRVPGCDPRNLGSGRGRLAWFNTKCFVNPPFGTYGNSRLGAIVEPGINNWDISIGKTITTHLPIEAGRAQIRADFFNALNHTQWGPPSENMTSTTFGQISTTRDPRIIQVSARLSF